MTLRPLYDRLERMPFVRIAAPFAAGIALADSWTWPLWFTAGAFVLAGLLALLFRSQVAAAVLLAATGVGAVQLRTGEPAVPRGAETLFELVIDEFPVDRGRYTIAEATVAAWLDPATGSWHPAAERIRLYADSLAAPAGGERIRCVATIRPLGGQAHYRTRTTRRGLRGTLRLTQRNVLDRQPPARRSLHRAAAGRMARLGAEGGAGAVVRAMTTGDRSGLSAEQRAAYARSGLSHLLALSGLHAGILFALVNAALWWLPLLRHGHRLRNAAAIAAVWLFVAAAGFPASAVRAAVMCTLLQAALATSSRYDGLNALGAASFGMLLWNPAWLYDAGFGLSVTAVAGILAWGVPLARRLRTGRRWVDLATAALAVSLAATAATAPLVARTFGAVPLAGIVLTPAAVLLAGVVVGCGALWLLLPLPSLAPPLRLAAGLAAEGIDALTAAAAALPPARIEVGLTAAQTAACYLAFVAATAAAWCVERKKVVHLPS